jgi:hypothetical protein
MKPALLILSFLISSALMAQNKDSIAFHVHYTPSTVYTQLMTIQMAMNTNFDSSSQEILDALKSQNIDSLLNKKQTTQTSIVVTTGKLGLKHTMPIEMHTDRTAGPTDALSPKMNAYGSVGEVGNPTFDSVSVAGMDSTQTAAVMKSIGTLLSQYTLPDVKMPIGGSYTQVIPFNLPNQGMGASVAMNMEITYTLTSVKNGQAFFDIALKIQMDVSGGSLDAPLRAQGEGGGNMVYDLKAGFPTQNKLHYTLHMRMEKQGMIMRMGISFEFNNDCTIAAAVL